MKLLSRNPVVLRERAPKTPGRSAPPPQDALTDGISHEIGARFETVSQRLDDAVELFERIQPLSVVIDTIREAVAAEYEERRAEHGELLGLRATRDQLKMRMDALEVDHREACTRLAKTEAELFDAQERLDADKRRLDAAVADEQKLRNDLATALTKVSQLGDSLKGALESVSQLSEDRENLRDQLAVSEDRRREADAASGRNNQQALLALEELGVLRKQLEAASADVTRMSRQVSELEGLLGGERARVRGIEASLASVQEESVRATRAVEARLEATRMELTVANGKLETYLAQTAKLETLHAEGVAKLNESHSKLRTTERQLAELHIDFNRAEERNRALDEELGSVRVRLATVESARSAAVERSDQLSKQLHSNEIALKRAEGRATELRDRLETGQTDHAHRRSALEERLANLEAGLERERAERIIAEGALEGLRRERGRQGAPDSDT